METGELGSRFEPAPLVLAGDVLVLLAFVSVGLASHGESAVQRPIYWIRTAAPFVVGWLVTSSALGAQSRRARNSYRYAARTSTLSWLSGALLGALLRYTPRFFGDLGLTVTTVVVALQFTLVMTTFGLLFVLPWRMAAVYLSNEPR